MGAPRLVNQLTLLSWPNDTHIDHVETALKPVLQSVVLLIDIGGLHDLVALIRGPITLVFPTLCILVLSLGLLGMGLLWMVHIWHLLVVHLGVFVHFI